MTIVCPSCTEALDVGDEARAVVALCQKSPSIWTCPQEHWGSPATRFGYGREEKPSHVIQTQPEVFDAGAYEQFRVRVLAAAGVGIDAKQD